MSDQTLPTMSEYFDKHVAPLDYKFRRWTAASNSTVVCPLHEDNDPSMGFISTREGEKYHCFGCGSAGTLVQLHQRVQRQWFNKRMSEDQAREDLYALYGIKPEDIPEDSPWTRRLERDKAIKSIGGFMGISDLRREFSRVKGKRQVDEVFTRFLIQDNFLENQNQET